MSRKKIIAPSLLSANFARIEDEVKRLVAAGADWLHIDVMDGHFVNNLTIGAPVVKAIKPISPLLLDVHLMIEKPERYIEDFIQAGSDLITIHVESTTQVEFCLQKIRAAGVKAGITLRPGTAVEALDPYWHLVDMILVMTVEPGFGGQGFREDQLDKLKYVCKKRDREYPSVLIEVDGGVNEKTIGYCQDVDVIVAGSYVFKSDMIKAIQTLRG